MVYTTGTSLVLALIGFGILGARFASKALDASNIQSVMELMKQNFNVNPLLLLIPIIVIVMVAKKTPAIPGLFIGTLLGGVAAMVFQGASVADVMNAMQNGVTSETGNQVLDDLLTRGGYQSMMWTISLILAALTFGGILKKPVCSSL
jgi:NhaC family Na+:H+ antiporter